MDQQTPVFAMGSPPVRTKAPKRKLQRWQKQRHLGQKAPCQPYVKWFLIPPEKCASYSAYFVAATLEGDSYFKKLIAVESYGESFLHIPATNITPHITTTRLQARDLLYKNQNLRWILKRFLNHIRYLKLKEANDKDPITMSSPENPIYLIKLRQGFQYIFEAESMMRDMHKKLVNNEGQIPNPLFPRNALTNEPFNLFELMSIYKQCKAFGKTTWAIEGFANCQFNIHRFLLLFRKQLRISALNHILRDNNDYYGIDLLLDFIEMECLRNNCIFSEALYRWAISNMTNNIFIVEWRILCKKYNEIEITHDDEDSRYQAFETIHKKCVPLVAATRNKIIEIRTRLRKNRLTRVDGSTAAENESVSNSGV
jgi:hypothetical protein